MDFLPDADQDALVEATRHYIDSCIPLADSITRLDDVRWKEIAALGWLGLATEESAGGAGAALLDEVFVFREIGRALVPGPILTTLAAARLAAWRGQTTLSRELIGGQARVARAVAVPDGRLLLLDVENADFVLWVADDRIVLHQAPPHPTVTAGLQDGTSVGHACIAELRSAVIAADDPQTIGRLRRVLSVLTAAQLAGICGATRDLATAYAQTRIQFGKPIGAFQAIKHKCADMATNALAADNITFFAALRNETDYPALAAASCCRRAALANARNNIHIHGAMGFTVEDHAHRFLKRTHTLCVTESFDRAAERLGGLPNAQTSEET